jgi:phage tail sheath protein FI
LNLSEFGAIYWPQVKVLNPNTAIFGNDSTIVVPPSGHIAGVMARTDASQEGGVYLQPAGIERGILRGVVGFENDDVKQESTRDLIYPKRINPLTTGPGLPLFIDGSRTLKGTSNFPSVAERRGVIFIEQSVKLGVQFARHSGNTEELRDRVNRAITAFLLIQYRNGAFRGDTPSNSFFVDTGEGLNPPSVVFANKLVARIGLATNKPAEFIILRFSQDTRELEEEIAAATA